MTAHDAPHPPVAVHRRTAGVAALALGAGAALAGAVALAAVFRGDAGLAAVLPWIQRGAHLVVAAGTLLWFLAALRRPGADAFAPTRAFVALYLIWFALGSVDLVAPDPDTPLWDPVPLRLWTYIALGIGAYLAGSACVPRYAGAATWADPARWKALVRGWHRRRAGLVLVSLYALALAGWGIHVLQQGGLPLLQPDVAVARIGASHGIFYSVFISAELAYTPLALLFAWSVDDLPRWGRRAIYASVAAVPFLAVSLGSRGLALEPVLLAVLTYHYAKRALPVSRLMALGVIAVVFLSLLGIQRDLLHYGPAHFAKFVEWGFPLWSLPFTYIYGYVRDPVVTFARLTAVVPDFIPFQHGAIFIRPLATFLPGHQEMADVIFKRMLRADFVGFGEPATLLGSLYVDQGALAIALGMFAFGLACRYVHRTFVLRPTPFALLLHIWMVHVALLSLFGGLFPYITTLFVPLLMLFLTATLAMGRVSRAGAGAPAA